jgi:hypothetical protein
MSSAAARAERRSVLQTTTIDCFHLPSPDYLLPNAAVPAVTANLGLPAIAEEWLAAKAPSTKIEMENAERGMTVNERP